ncbi:MAG: prolyl oligopeptidase family serine peptidase, partial [Pseudomonadota bacterium]
FQSKNYPEFWENGLDHWQRYFGDPKNEADLALMREFSPSNLVDQLHGPILLIGGELDPVTDVAQAKSFEAAAREQGKSVEAHYFANAGHGATHWRDKFKRARLIEDFLAEHAGGRSGGLDWVELVPSFIQ